MLYIWYFDSILDSVCHNTEIAAAKSFLYPKKINSQEVEKIKLWDKKYAILSKWIKKLFTKL